MAADRIEFVVDTGAMSGAGRRSAAALVLDLLAPDIEAFECDIPWSREGAWPDEVRAAAEHLSTLARRRRSENDSYRQTGIVRRADDSTWRAFVTFAPYAFDAAAWDVNRRKLVDLADEGASFVVRMNDAEAGVVARALSDQVVVSLEVWRGRA